MDAPAMYTDADKTRLDGSVGVGSHEAHRNVFRKDYARLIHAPAFRRLQSKTQLFPGVESDFFRNRLTHSIEVAQIAGGIAQVLNGARPELQTPALALDIDLVQFAGAAHDLGHPPFGHNGEKALDDAMKKYGGFEGNAQTLRILSRLEKKATVSDPGRLGNTDQFGRLGLNLCYRSLAAILKYDDEIPGVRNDGDKLAKGFYATEALLVASIKRAVAPSWPSDKKFKTIECQIMDVADDIAYSTYDLEDTLKGGFISPMQIIREVESNAPLVEAVNEEVQRALKEDGVLEPVPLTSDEIVSFLNDIFFADSDSSDSDKPQQALDRFSVDRDYVEDGYVRTALTSWLVGAFMDAVEFTFDAQCPAMSTVRLKPETRREVEILKHLNYMLTIRSPRLAVVQYRGYDLVRKIFEALTTDTGRDLLPHDVRALHDQCHTVLDQMRVVCDFIAGMTDRYAVEFYGRLYGGDHTIFKPF
jgi:dGTPase